MTGHKCIKSYLAGFFDGEGWVGYHIVKRPNRTYFRLAVGIVQTNYEVINIIHKLYGGHIVKPTRRPNRKQHWQVNLIGRYAYYFLLDIEKYLIVKKEITNLCMEAFEFSFSNSYNVLFLPTRKEIQKEYYRKYKKLIRR